MQTRNMAEYLLADQNTTVLEPTGVQCRAEDGHVNLLIVVHSATSHGEERTTIRETWGRVAKEDLPDVRLIFLLGMPPTLELQRAIVASQAEI